MAETDYGRDNRFRFVDGAGVNGWVAAICFFTAGVSIPGDVGMLAGLQVVALTLGLVVGLCDHVAGEAKGA